MRYLSPFSRSYQINRDPRICAEVGRDPQNCPAEYVARVLLQPAYGDALDICGCEVAMSLVSRPDPVFAMLQGRSLRRSFIFQDSGPMGAKELVGCIDVRCPSREEVDDLKKAETWEGAALCAAGYLRPPRSMTDVSGYHLPLLGPYSVHGGLLPFDCTPFVSHFSFFGYVCVQAAAYMCLEMMLPGGAAAHSPAALSHIVASKHREEALHHSRWPFLCKMHLGEPPADGYYCRGLFPKEIQILFDQEDELATRCLAFDAAASGNEGQEDIAFDHMRAMLDSKIPVLACVDYASIERSLGAVPLAAFAGGDELVSHVVTLVGYRTSPRGERSVVFHDGHLGPYRELSLGDFVGAARNAPWLGESRDARPSPAGRILMFSPVPMEVAADAYRQMIFIARSGKEDGDSSIRLIRLHQLGSHLARFAGGHQVSGEAMADLLKRVSPMEETESAVLGGTEGRAWDPLVWIIERVRRRTRRVMVEILRSDTTRLDRRLAWVVVEPDSVRGSWYLVVPKTEAARSIGYCLIPDRRRRDGNVQYHSIYR